MATYKYSALSFSSNAITLPSTTGTFSTSDQLFFDVQSFSAADLTLGTSGSSLTINDGTNTITLRNFTQNKMSGANFTFLDGSQLVIGDNTTGTTNDTAANTFISTDGDDYFDGMTGTDTISYATASSAVTVALNSTANTAGTVSGGGGVDKILNVENIIGSAYNDTLTGTTGANDINGGLGFDELIGLAGDDVYTVTAGDTVTEASAAGTDTVKSSFDYVLPANVEKLILSGSAIYGSGNSGDNTITGTTGNNVLDAGSAGTDSLVGGDGNDTYIVSHTGVTISETSTSTTQIDTVISSFAGLTTLATNVENLRLITTGTDGTGNASNNIIYANGLANTIDGAGGTDTLSYQFGLSSSATAGVTLTLGAAGAAATAAGGSGADVISNIEYVIGSRLSDSITGNDVANSLTGGLGNDTLTAGASTGDTLDGGAGNDTYVVTGATSYKITDVSGTDTLSSATDVTIATFTTIENVTTIGSAAVIGTGNSLANTMTGSSTGIDELVGGTGNDTYVISELQDIVTEELNAGTDTVQVSVTGYTLADNVENLTLAGAAAISGTGNDVANIITASAGFADTLIGGTGNDKLVGNSVANELDGGEGNDNMTGGNGGDTYIVDSTGDSITEASADTGTDIVQSSVTYTLGANLETLTLTGTGTINGTGNTGANTLTGNSVANTLTGGLGADTITGGDGKDKIVLTESTSSADEVVFGATFAANDSDTITGFTSGTDIINLNAVTAETATTAVTGSLTNVVDLVYFLDGQAAGSADTLSAAAAAITAAATWTSASVVTNIIVVDDNSTAIYEWTDVATTDGATASELKLMGTIDAVTTSSDYVFA